MPSATQPTPVATPIALKLSDDAQTVSYQDPTSWNVTAAPAVYRSKNKIRSVVAGLDLSHTTSTKPLINLGLGDPTVFGLHPAPEVSISAVQEALVSGTANGYVPGTGDKAACAAVARYHSKWDGVDYSGDDVTLVHGASHGLDMCFSTMTSPGHNVLIPAPGFPAYETLLGNIENCEIRFYDCLPERGWECDVEQMERLIDDKTSFVLITNPSNPCGNNMHPDHLKQLVALAQKKKVPIIADEIYGHMQWSEHPFVPLASLTSEVPIITLSGLSKRFLLPGWRFGWIVLHDPSNHASALRHALHCWGNRIMGPCSLIQKALPRILDETPESWFNEVVAKLENNAKTSYEMLTAIPGLYCTFPTAAMYLLLGVDIAHFPDFASDVEFCAALVKDQALFCIPGQSFGIDNHMRLVIAAPNAVLVDACERLKDFCAKYYVA